MVDQTSHIFGECIYPDPDANVCGDSTCYRGRIGENYQFKDGPCAAENCQWPKGVKPRPHFTDNPSQPIFNAGKAALEEKKANDAKRRERAEPKVSGGSERDFSVYRLSCTHSFLSWKT
jgi:hypothetical protein